MKKALAIILICAVLVLTVGCSMMMSKEDIAANNQFAEDIKAMLDYEADITCWQLSKGADGLTANIKPTDPVADDFGSYIIQGVRAAKKVLGAKLKTLTIGYVDGKDTVVFSLGEANYGTIMDSRTEQVYHYATEDDIAIDYPSAAKYLTEE